MLIAGHEYDRYHIMIGDGISPNGRYIVLEALQEYVEPDDAPSSEALRYAYFSGEICIVDLSSRSVINFFNCSLDPSVSPFTRINENVSIVQWIEES